MPHIITKRSQLKQNISLALLITSGMLVFTTSVVAQINVPSTAVYQNQYLLNPAIAGREQNLILNASVSKLFNTFPGSPAIQSFSADYGFTNKAGVGAMVNIESAGVLRRTRVTGTFAYHLPLNSEDQQLHFGLSMSAINNQLKNSAINGDMSDPDLYDVNWREGYVDGDFGMALTTKKLTIQGALPNMNRLFKKEILRSSDLPIFFSAVSYQFFTSFGSLEPKVMYRGVKGYDDLVDAGVKVKIDTDMDNSLHFTGLYHSSKSATFGFGFDFKNTFSFNGMYTTSSSSMQGYTNGNFEAGIMYRVGGK